MYSSAHCVNTDKPLFFGPEHTESPVLHDCISYWQQLKGDRRYPARADVTLRGLGRLARYAVLVRVLPDDYEYRFVGNVPVTALGCDFTGRRFSEPEVGAKMRANYRYDLLEKVRETGEPWVFKARYASESGLPLHSETVFMPLGTDDIDHVLGFTVCLSPWG